MTFSVVKLSHDNEMLMREIITLKEAVTKCKNEAKISYMEGVYDGQLTTFDANGSIDFTF